MAQAQSRPSSPRVALVTGGLKLGGATIFLVSFGGELTRRRIPVQVFSFEKENPLASDFTRLGVPVFCQDERRVIFEDRVCAVCQELARFQPTAVVASLGGISFEVLRYMPAGVFRVGLAQTHDPGVYAVVRRYTAHLDLMAGVSRLVTQTLSSLPEFASVPVAYLPLGVPMPQHLAALGFESGAPLRILYLGRLDEEQKRVRLFPRIFEQLTSSGIPFHWTIAGEGPERSFLEGALKSTATGQTVSFTGRVLYDQVPKLLAAHDVFLLASDYEGLPLSLLEAMGSGLVPVVSDLPSGIRDVVDETNGKRVPPDQITGYAEAIVWLHAHRAEMKRLSEKARAKVQAEFSVAAMADRWLGALRPPETGVRWPVAWKIQPPLGSPSRLRFSSLGRTFSRWLMRFRS